MLPPAIPCQLPSPALSVAPAGRAAYARKMSHSLPQERGPHPQSASCWSVSGSLRAFAWMYTGRILSFSAGTSLSDIFFPYYPSSLTLYLRFLSAFSNHRLLFFFLLTRLLHGGFMCFTIRAVRLCVHTFCHHYLMVTLSFSFFFSPSAFIYPAWQ